MIQGIQTYTNNMIMKNQTNNKSKNTEGAANFNTQPQYELQADAVLSTIHIETGESIGIFYDESSTESNPVMLARVKQLDGSVRETKIEVNKVNPSDASYVEMLALSAHLKKEGKTDGPAGGLATMVLNSRAKEANSKNIYEKTDFLPAMQEFVSSALKDGQMATYLRYLKEMNIYTDMAKKNEKNNNIY